MSISAEKLELIVQELANMPEQQRNALLNINFSDLKGLQGDELRKRISKFGLY